MAESFDIDQKSSRIVKIGQDSLDKYGYTTAKEMVKDAFERISEDSDDGNDDGETVGKRRYSRGYKSGGSDE